MKKEQSYKKDCEKILELLIQAKDLAEKTKIFFEEKRMWEVSGSMGHLEDLIEDIYVSDEEKPSGHGCGNLLEIIQYVEVK